MQYNVIVYDDLTAAQLILQIIAISDLVSMFTIQIFIPN